MKCTHIKINGIKCEGNAMNSNSFCYAHNPTITEEAKREARAKGGRENKIMVRDAMAPMELTQVKDVVSLLENTVNKVRSGELDLKIANALGFLAGHLIKALELAELEGRVEQIERVIVERRTK